MSFKIISADYQKSLNFYFAVLLLLSSEGKMRDTGKKKVSVSFKCQ